MGWTSEYIARLKEGATVMNVHYGRAPGSRGKKACVGEGNPLKKILQSDSLDRRSARCNGE
jgi:hypothetical protein